MIRTFKSDWNRLRHTGPGGRYPPQPGTVVRPGHEDDFAPIRHPDRTVAPPVQESKPSGLTSRYEVTRKFQRIDFGCVIVDIAAEGQGAAVRRKCWTGICL